LQARFEVGTFGLMINHVLIVLLRYWFPIGILFGLYVACIVGLVGVDLGVPNLVRDPEDLANFIVSDFTAIRNSPVWNVFLFLPLLAGLIWVFSASTLRRQSPNLSASKFTPANLFAGTLFLSIIALACFVARISIDPSNVGIAGEIGRALFGLVLGLILTTSLEWALTRWPLRTARSRYMELCVIRRPTSHCAE
jgi:hypothetical protein